MTVPLSPDMASVAFSSEHITALRPGFDSANLTAAFTLGSMLPGAKCPSAAYFSASAGVSARSSFMSGLPKFMHTRSTAVRI